MKIHDPARENSSVRGSRLRSCLSIPVGILERGLMGIRNRNLGLHRTTGMGSKMERAGVLDWNYGLEDRVVSSLMTPGYRQRAAERFLARRGIEPEEILLDPNMSGGLPKPDIDSLIREYLGLGRKKKEFKLGLWDHPN